MNQFNVKIILKFYVVNCYPYQFYYLLFFLETTVAGFRNPVTDLGKDDNILVNESIQRKNNT